MTERASAAGANKRKRASRRVKVVNDLSDNKQVSEE